MFLSELDRHTTGQYQWSRGTMAEQGYAAAGNSEPAVDPRTKPGMEVFQLLQAHSIWVSWLFNHCTVHILSSPICTESSPSTCLKEE